MIFISPLSRARALSLLPPLPSLSLCCDVDIHAQAGVLRAVVTSMSTGHVRLCGLRAGGSCGSKSASQFHLNFRAVHFCMYNYWLPRQILVNTRTPLIDALGEMRVDNPLSISLSTTPSLARLHVCAFSFSLSVVILISGFLSLCLSVTPSLCRSQTHSLAYTHSKTHTHATLPLSS